MAKGSQITYGGWETRTCSRCGGKIAVTRRTDSYHFSRYGGPNGAPVSRHAGRCPTVQGARA